MRYEGRTRNKDQGISRNMDHFMEELRREQEAHDRRTAEFEKRPNESMSQLQNYQTEKGATILDDREGAVEEDEEDWEEEYVVLDLDDVFHGAPVPNFSYTLSGLDTLNPILTLDNGLKLIGRYVETIGSVVIYSEKEKDVFEAQADTRELPIPADPYAVNTVKKPLKRIRGVCKLERKLKFCAMPIEHAPVSNGMFMQSASVQNPTMQMAGNATTQMAGNATTQMAGNATTQMAGNATTQMAGNATMQMAGNATMQMAGNATMQMAGNATMQMAGNATMQMAGNATMQMTEDAAHVINIVPLEAALHVNNTMPVEDASLEAEARKGKNLMCFQ